MVIRTLVASGDVTGLRDHLRDNPNDVVPTNLVKHLQMFQYVTRELGLDVNHIDCLNLCLIFKTDLLPSMMEWFATSGPHERANLILDTYFKVADVNDRRYLPIMVTLLENDENISIPLSNAMKFMDVEIALALYELVSEQFRVEIRRAVLKWNRTDIPLSRIGALTYAPRKPKTGSAVYAACRTGSISGVRDALRYSENLDALVTLALRFKQYGPEIFEIVYGMSQRDEIGMVDVISLRLLDFIVCANDRIVAQNVIGAYPGLRQMLANVL